MAGRTTTPLAVTPVAALVLALLAVLPAHSAPTWLLPPAHVDANDAVVPKAAVSPAGHAVVAFYQFIGAGKGVVRVTERAPGGAWTPSVAISDPAYLSIAPDVVVDAAGNATAAWRTYKSASSSVVQASFRPSGGTWGPALDLTVIGTDPFAIDLAVDAAGTVTAVWTRLDSMGATVIESVSRTVGGAWTAPETRSTGTANTFPSVAAGPAGTVTVAYVRSEGAIKQAFATSRAPSGTWSTPEPISLTSTDVQEPRALMDGGGRALVVWPRHDGADYVVQYAERPSGGTWSAPADLSDPGGDAYRVKAAMNQKGDVVVGWHRDDGAHYRMQVTERRAGAGWEPPVTLSAAGQYARPSDVAVDPSGGATAVWARENGLISDGSAVLVVQSAWRAAGGAWVHSPDLTPAAINSDVYGIAVDAAGDVVIPLAMDTTPYGIDLTALDVAGPAVTGFAVPAGATTGHAAAFSATATDTWSSVASYAWSFGDGTTATGPAATHVYAKPGGYTVALTVTDAVGNATTRTATVAVTAPVPAISAFKLKKKTIATDEKTKLKIRLNTGSTLKLVFKSKHQHVIKGKKKYVRLVLKRQVPAGLSKITIKAKVKGKVLEPDTYVITGTAKNATGKSPKKKTKLKVVR